MQESYDQFDWHLYGSAQVRLYQIESFQVGVPNTSQQVPSTYIYAGRHVSQCLGSIFYAKGGPYVANFGHHSTERSNWLDMCKTDCL